MNIMKGYLLAFLFALIGCDLLAQSGMSPAREVHISARADDSGQVPHASVAPRPTAPANLEISDVSFSDQYGNSNSVLDANEEAEISFTLSNLGKGNAHAMAANISPLNQRSGAGMVARKQLGDLIAGQSMMITLPLRGIPLLISGKVELEIRVEE